MTTRPTLQDIAAAAGRTIPDVIADDLAVLLVGINPGLYSGAVGHHFARPGNRFWKALHAGGFTPRVLRPDQERDLVAHGIGITNIVARATARADELGPAELREGARRLERIAAERRPRFVAFLGLGAYRTAFGRRHATAGEQPERLADARVWLLPNPSGLNAHHQLADLSRAFAELRSAITPSGARAGT